MLIVMLTLKTMKASNGDTIQLNPEPGPRKTREHAATAHTRYKRWSEIHVNTFIIFISSDQYTGSDKQKPSLSNRKIEHNVIGSRT
jgi:hypothetical protein